MAISRGQPAQACSGLIRLAVAPERLGSKIRRGGSRLTSARPNGDEGGRQQHNSAPPLRQFKGEKLKAELSLIGEYKLEDLEKLKRQVER